MAKWTGPVLIGAGVLGLAGVTYLYLTKDGKPLDLAGLLDFKWLTDYLDSLFGVKPKPPGEEPEPKPGNGNGDGDGKEPKPPGGKEPPPVTGTTKATVVLGAAGDWGSGRNSNWKKTADNMKKNNVELALGLGDYSYTNLSDWQKVVDYLKKAGIAMKGAEGNHDSSSYAKSFGQPSFLYSFTIGYARIIILNTESGGASKNASFLEKTLKANKSPWPIVIMHKPLYTSSSKHNAENSLANALKPILDKYKVPLVMYGHNHNYERIKFPNRPTMFVMSGTGGEDHYNLSGKTGNVVYHNASDFGFTKLVVTQNSLKGSFIANSGKTLDSWTQNTKAVTAKLAYAYPIYESPTAMRISI